MSTVMMQNAEWPGDSPVLLETADPQATWRMLTQCLRVFVTLQWTMVLIGSLSDQHGSETTRKQPAAGSWNG